MTRRRMIALALAVILLSASDGSVDAQVAAGEYQIKAAYLRSFSDFVEWPPEAVAPNAPITIALIGDDPFGRAIDDVLAEKRSGRRIRIRRLRWNESTAGCQIAFISSSELHHLDHILAGMRGQSVLTVGDFDRFALRGGIIELRTINGRVKFDANTGAAAAARLKISSKLLKLARNVYPSSTMASKVQ